VKCPSYESRHGDAPFIDSVVLKDEENETLTILAVNKDLENDFELSSDLRQFEGYEVKDHLVMTHNDIKAVNTEENPDNVKPVETTNSKLDGGVLTSLLPSKSWNVIILIKN
jgi:alpha-N-arabinofuranosidase